MSLSYRGKELLKEYGEDTRGGGHTLKLIRGRRYGFLGDNGCGKTTLLRRFAAGTMPGFPRHLRTLLVVRAMCSLALSPSLSLSLSLALTLSLALGLSRTRALARSRSRSRSCSRPRPSRQRTTESPLRGAGGRQGTHVCASSREGLCAQGQELEGSAATALEEVCTHARTHAAGLATAHSTQHTAHSTQHTAHSTQPQPSLCTSARCIYLVMDTCSAPGIYIYIYVCVCVCVCVPERRWWHPLAHRACAVRWWCLRVRQARGWVLRQVLAADTRATELRTQQAQLEAMLEEASTAAAGGGDGDDDGGEVAAAAGEAAAELCEQLGEVCDRCGLRRVVSVLRSI
jgi:energy-coupling factor transporter ATP-binding protein EcfA2